MASRLFSFRAIATALALTAVISSCSDDEDDNNNAPATGMSWTVDGGNATTVRTVVQDSANFVSIEGYTSASGPGNAVILEVPNKVGTFPISLLPSTTNSAAVYAKISATDTTAYLAASGNVVITSYTKSATAGASTAVGTFTFTGVDFGGTTPKTLTNGKFNIKF